MLTLSHDEARWLLMLLDHHKAAGVDEEELASTYEKLRR
jgi:hypothetical protein